MSGATIDLASLIGDNLVSKSGALKGDDLKGKTVALYFSAHWCPPCRAFTPSLAEAYSAAKKAGADFELIFVSSDQDDEGFDEYWATMPFPAVKFDAEEVREKLGATFGISGIPSLQVVDKNGKLITKEGRSVVTKEKSDAFVQWAKAA